MNTGIVFVAGSAHLDVLGQITGDEGTVDKVGDATIEIGGTACNIAVNLASLGFRPRLLTAMREQSPYSKIVASYLKEHGVDVRIVNQESLRAAVFSVHIGADGEMLSAVSSMPVEFATFDDDVVSECMENAKCAILECNLSGKTLEQFTRIAGEKNIPVYISGVSEEKSLRIADINSRIQGVYFNSKEARYFGKRIVANTNPLRIADKLGCNVVVTQDRNGVSVIESGEEHFVAPPELNNPIHTLGAGDALMAYSVVKHIFEGIPLSAAVEGGVQFAKTIIERNNCNAGNGAGMEMALINLDNMATKDIMTGLTNRRAAEKFLSIAQDNHIRSGVTYSLLMVDIDHFKRVNDTFGHDVGDEAIKAVAGVLNATVRSGDVACRWGGEEFICILNGADVNTAQQVGERIRHNVEQLNIPVVEHVTVSIGIAAADQHSNDWHVLFKNADLGLYDAKQGGRNRVCAYRKQGVQTEATVT